MDFKTCKLLGGIGSLLIFLEVIPTLVTSFTGVAFYGILRILGIVFVLFSLYNLANFYQVQSIFTNAKLGAIVAIVGTIFGAVWGVFLLPTTVSVTYFVSLLLFLGVSIVFFIIAAVFVQRSLNELAARSGVSQFVTAGRLLYFGALLFILVLPIIVLGVGFLVLASAFFKMKPPVSATVAPDTVISMDSTNKERF
ncbi:MAG: DUF996 domain-containing protein [Nitrososphaerota archaeon]|jgi:uncharacterized membrane protein|nr:DUF996 domain-containing protein [Nitrososphaerota archaeon]